MSFDEMHPFDRRTLTGNITEALEECFDAAVAAAIEKAGDCAVLEHLEHMAVDFPSVTEEILRLVAEAA